jgi:hypothetical protein
MCDLEADNIDQALWSNVGGSGADVVVLIAGYRIDLAIEDVSIDWALAS